MFKRLSIVASALMLGGCALPVPFQIASWAVDGLVLVATEKTIADHGVSMLAQRDCAMFRIATEGALCRDGIGMAAVTSQELPPPAGADDEKGIVLADAGGIVADTPAVGTDTPDPAELAAFETAAGRAGSVREPGDEIPPDEDSIAEAQWEAIIAAPVFFDEPGELIVAEPKRQSAPETASEMRSETPSEPIIELAIEGSPPGNHTGLPFAGGDNLNLGDILFDLQPYLAIDLTLMGGASGDILQEQTPPLRDRGLRPDERARPALTHDGRSRGRGPPTRRARSRGSGRRPRTRPHGPRRFSGFRCVHGNLCV